MNLYESLAEIPVVILCGGKGILVEEQKCKRINKALVLINEKPLFYWVMLSYAIHGATDFFLAAGFQSEHFDNVLTRLGAKVVSEQQKTYVLEVADNLCRISVIETPLQATTGSRLLACKPALDALGIRENFAVAYSDTLCDVNLSDQLRFHKEHGLIATLLSARLPVRFRIIGVRPNEATVRGFASRPVIETARVNGGFYIFSSAFWQFLNTLGDDLPLENLPLEKLANANQLIAYEHNGYWQTCDSERDLSQLHQISQECFAPIDV